MTAISTTIHNFLKASMHFYIYHSQWYYLVSVISLKLFVAHDWVYNIWHDFFSWIFSWVFIITFVLILVHFVQSVLHTPKIKMLHLFWYNTEYSAVQDILKVRKDMKLLRFLVMGQYNHVSNIPITKFFSEQVKNEILKPKLLKTNNICLHFLGLQ